ncbi:MAG: restriction endonuclease [Acetobacteraceae bacterium]
MTAGSPALSDFARVADALREQEFTRLAAAVVPAVESLRLVNGKQLRVQVGTMLERLGYELLTTENAGDLVTLKDGKKYVVAFAEPSEHAPTPIGQLTRLHSVVVAASAAAGFFITPRGFTRDAESYAATAPLKLVDGPKLVASIKRSMEGVTVPESYQAMYRRCGRIVRHQLDRRDAIPCRNWRTATTAAFPLCAAPRGPLEVSKRTASNSLRLIQRGTKCLEKCTVIGIGGAGLLAPPNSFRQRVIR